MQFGKATQSVMQLISDNYTSISCCSTSGESCELEETSQESQEDCCVGDDCQCTCCQHIVFYKSIELAYAQSLPFKSSTHLWRFNYQQDFLGSVFHPPLV